MPAQGNQALPFANVVFAEGVITMTLPGGAPDGVTLGVLQEVSCENKWTKKKLMSGGSNMPRAVGISERVVSIKAKSGAFFAGAIVAACGGVAVYNAGANTTTITSSGNDKPPVIAITLKSASDGSDITVKFGKVIADSDMWDLKTHDFGMNDWQAEAYPDPANSDAVWTMTLPGNQTAS